LILITTPVPRRAVPIALLAALAFAASGCGRAGPLEPPPDATAVAKPADSAASSPDELQIHKRNPPITPPKTSFVLDPLL
jgi:predicted small lipoprotein YifL